MSIHLHTTISPKANKILEDLTKIYGAKNRVLEEALDTFLRVKEVGSCDDCEIKAKITEQKNLRETLDLISIDKKSLNGLFEVATGDKSFEEFVENQLKESYNIIAVLKDSIRWKTPASFKEFLLLLEEIKTLTRLFDIASYNELDKTVILRTRVLEKIPETVANHIAIILEGAGAPFDLRLMGDDIVLKMVRGDVFPLRKREFDKTLSQQIRKRAAMIKPGFFQNNLILTGPGFLHWAQKHLEEPIADMGAIIEDIRIVLGINELPKNPRDFIEALISAGVKMNWLKDAKVIEEDKENNIITLVFTGTSPAITKIAINAFSVMLATRGWRLEKHSIEHVNGSLTIKLVESQDQSLLDELTEINTYQTISQQFLDVIPIPRDILNSFALKVFETDRKRFDGIYNSAGVRISNAIRMLARNNPEKIQRYAENFILKNLNALKTDAEVRFVDKEQFTIIFKRINPLLMNEQKILVESIFKELGYKVTTTMFQNLLSFKLKHVEKPILAPVPRKIIMQNLIDVMSASNVQEAFMLVKKEFDEFFPEEYPWTIREVGERLTEMYREVDIEVEIEYFEGGFTLKYKTCPYYKLVKSGQKKWLCNFRKKTIEYIISRVTHGKGGKIKIIKSLIQNEHPCEYAVFLKGFLQND